MESPIIISHINADGLIQSNEDHQNGVAELCKEFASKFNMPQWGWIIGLLHDKGKEKNSFQQHIIKESGLDSNIIVDGDYSHAYIGALVAKRIFPSQSPLISNIIMGHHRGLYDEGEKQNILNREIPSEIKLDDINTTFERPHVESPKDVHHLIRILFSCLVDADYLDTERFMLPKQFKARGNYSSMHQLLEKLETYLDSIKRTTQKTDVNIIRNYVQEQCRKMSNNAPDFYSLTVPTGGGKTLSSILWALKHAIKNNKQRIIIAIPYTSIITQTASVLKNIFGENNVLEHHSNVVYQENEQNNKTIKKLKLASENWDFPIIVTTNVQLFESLFSNKPSNCRKLHNIVNSVLILDEVQTLPIGFLHSIVDTFDTLKRIFGTSILFTTASQPILTGQISRNFMGLPHITEIIPKGAMLHDKLRRAELFFDEKISTYDEITNKISQHSRVLCIVNTRNDAKEIYNRLPKDGYNIHLSRMMCSQHLKETINNLKELLATEVNKPIRVISTQLIEAGVDIDFPIVFRQEAGLDSILQAAGRCNREGKLKIGTTIVFKLANRLPLGLITQANNARINMGTNLDWFSVDTMFKYYTQLYSRVDINGFDIKQITKLLYNVNDMQFETASKEFKLISDNSYSVIVNWKDSLKLLEHIKTNGISREKLNLLTQYSVNIRQQDKIALEKAGAITEILEGIYVVENEKFYDNKIGLCTNNQWLEEILIA